MTPVFGLCDDYVTRWAALDPVAAGMQGVTGVFGAATDYGPDGTAARAELITSTLAALAPMSITSDADRLAASFLRERLEAQLASHQLNEPLRAVRAPIGLISIMRDSVDLLPRDGDDAWRNIAARLAAIPAMFGSWRASLDAGLARGLPRRPTRATRKSPATCGRTTRRGPRKRTASEPNGTRSRPGSTSARTSTSRRPTSGAGLSCGGSKRR
jgi:hypothetical protein